MSTKFVWIISILFISILFMYGLIVAGLNIESQMEHAMGGREAIDSMTSQEKQNVIIFAIVISLPFIALFAYGTTLKG